MNTLHELSIPYETRYGQKKELLLDLRHKVNCLVTGHVASGKTSFLRTIASGSVKKYGEDNINVWYISFKNPEFNDLISSCAAIKAFTVNSDEEIRKVVHTVFAEVQRRREMCITHQVASYSNDDERSIGPRLLILIDDYYFLDKLLQTDEELRVMFERMLRECGTYGVSFVLTDQAPLSFFKGMTVAAKNFITVTIELNTDV